MQGFPTQTVDVWLISLLCEDCPVYCRVFNTIPGSRLMSPGSRGWEAGSPPEAPWVKGFIDSQDHLTGPRRLHTLNTQPEWEEGGGDSQTLGSPWFTPLTMGD